MGNGSTDGVNVAARLESLADPGGICISDTVHAQIRNKLPLSYEDLGKQQVKNIAQPVRVFRVMLEGGTTTRTTAKATERSLRKHWRGRRVLARGAGDHCRHHRPRAASLPTPPYHHRVDPPAHKYALPLASVPSIAVLPFTNMSGDREQEYFSDGITDDLITSLSRLPDLCVIARTFTFTYKG